MTAKFTFAEAEIYFGFLINQTLEVSLVENKRDDQPGKGQAKYVPYHNGCFWEFFYQKSI